VVLLAVRLLFSRSGVYPFDALLEGLLDATDALRQLGALSRKLAL
jgi:hypothetical protein